MATRRICEFLDGSGVYYVMTDHARVYTAQEVAHATHLQGKRMAKTVVIWLGGELALAVIPASSELDLAKVKTQTAATSVRLATEAEFTQAFIGCQVGAAPPFGNLFGMRTLVDLDLAYNTQINFNAGTHTQVIRMDFEDYRRLVRPLVVKISNDHPEREQLIFPSSHSKLPKKQDQNRQFHAQCSTEAVHHLGAD